MWNQWHREFHSKAYIDCFAWISEFTWLSDRSSYELTISSNSYCSFEKNKSSFFSDLRDLSYLPVFSADITVGECSFKQVLVLLLSSLPLNLLNSEFWHPFDFFKRYIFIIYKSIQDVALCSWIFILTCDAWWLSPLQPADCFFCMHFEMTLQYLCMPVVA